MVVSADEIAELKNAHGQMEKRLDQIGKDQRPSVAGLSRRLGGILKDIEEMMEKERTLWNPAPATRMKLAKKGMLLGKELGHFEADVTSEFDKGLLPLDIGRRLVATVKLARSGRMEAAKAEIKPLEEIANSIGECDRVEAELKEKDRALRREQLRIESTLAEIAALERESVDGERVQRHQELLENLEKLKALRAAYVRSLLSKPVAELLGEMEGSSLKEYYPAFPSKEETAGLRQFFSDYPVFGSCNPAQLCEFFEYNEKKLSHICPETTRFKRVVLGNRSLFETIGALERTQFLAVDGADGRTLDFYARKVEGAQEIVQRIRELDREKQADSEEYEKGRRIEKRKEELSKYQKNELEAKLAETMQLIAFLNSEEPDSGGTQEPSAKVAVAGKEEAAQTKEKGGMLSGIGKFLKRFS